jgi:hypothetical protein
LEGAAMRAVWLVALVALVALAACSKGPAPASNAAVIASAPTNAAAAPPAAASPKLAQIFTPDVIGSNVAFLETITGPAFRTDGSDRTYKVDGCEIIVGAAKGKIDNIGIVGYSQRCSFPIAQYFAGGYQYPVPNNPTFGDIKRGLGGGYGADCLISCGNAADPVVYLSYQGSHADNFNNLEASLSIADEPGLTAYTDWGQKLVAKYGEDYVIAAKFNSGDNLDDVASHDFAQVRPGTIRVGQNLAGPGGNDLSQ